MKNIIITAQEARIFLEKNGMDIKSPTLNDIRNPREISFWEKDGVLLLYYDGDGYHRLS